MAQPERTALRATTLHVTGSLPGPDCPLPAFTPMRALPPIAVGDADEAMASRVAFGRLSSPLPYARQSDYDRADDAVELPAFELTDGALTATVLPGLGGRVWSLRTPERELLFANPALRFANFGLTDAWFAGGIEWNLGSTGHWTLSSRPLHAARIETPTGDGLRLWEWERTRDLVIQIDLALDGDRLLAHTRVINPDPEPKPLYYWTNVAVPETTGTRVLSRASTAWRTDYSGRLARVAVPHPDDDTDISYPLRSEHAADYFFETEPPGRFVSAVEADGQGFAQTATDALRGRKLFLWGSSAGGARWQEWLSEPGARYTEIQAGWCTTQLEHDTLPGRTAVAWTEAFGAVAIEPEAVSAPFAETAEAVATAVHDGVPPVDLADRHARWLAERADAAPVQVLHTASPWGGAELALRDRLDERVTGAWLAALPFPASGEEDGANAVTRDGLPGVSARWQRNYAAATLDTHPWTRYARAVGAHLTGDRDRAAHEYEESVALAHHRGEQPQIGAVRGLALLAAESGDNALAAERYTAAVRAFPQERTLLTEAVAWLLSTDDPGAALTLLDEAPDAVARHGRNRLLRAHALLATGDREAAATILDDLEVPDLAEGGRELDELWTLVHPDRPLPARLDFRMKAD